MFVDDGRCKIVVGGGVNVEGVEVVWVIVEKVNEEGTTDVVVVLTLVVLLTGVIALSGVVSA